MTTTLTRQYSQAVAPSTGTRRRLTPRRIAGKIGLQLVCIVISVGLFATPLVYLAVQAFKSYPNFLRDPTGLPAKWTVANFSDAWQQGGFSRELINSLVYATVPTIITLILGVFLAFPISRGYLPKANLFYAFFVFSGFLPAGLIPLFIEAKNLHLYNSMAGYLVLTSLAGAGFFFFVGHIKTIPRELDEAAALDGCGYARFIFTIIIPEMKPALAAFGIFGFVAAWNNLILPIVMLADPSIWPITRGLYSFLGEHVQNWPLIAAGVMISATPIIVVFALLQRYLVAGIAGGAIAGSQAAANTALKPNQEPQS